MADACSGNGLGEQVGGRIVREGRLRRRRGV